MALVSSRKEPKDTAAIAAGAVAQSTSRLFDLPIELFDQIMDHLFVFPSPVEFSPIEYYLTMGSRPLGACQYQHAFDFNNHILPSLRALRVCKLIFEHGVQRYYSRNSFRLSSVFGWVILGRFLNLIGPSNTTLLRKIAIVHPNQRGVINDSGIWAGRRNFVLERLSPFRMTDLPDYRQSNTVFSPSRKDTIHALCNIANLEQLDLLVYSQKDRPTQHAPHTHAEHMAAFAGVNALDLHDAKVAEFPGLLPSRAMVTLVNLHEILLPYDKPLLLQVPSPQDPEAAADRATDHVSLAAANAIRSAMQKQGWKMVDVPFCPRSGVWPVRKEDYDMDEYEWVDSVCDDYEGWPNRDYLKRLYGDYIEDEGDDEDDDAYLEDLYPHYTGCVKCWRDVCACENGGTYLPRYWGPGGLVSANRGVPVEVDAREGGGLIWKKSEAEKDFESGWL